MNKSSTRLALLALVVAVIALIAAFSNSFAPLSRSVTPSKETAFERVMKTHTLRCAYALWPPHFMIDSATNTKSGINYEIMEAIGKTANLKIEWAEEVGYGAFAENLRSGKEDVFCSGAWMSVPRGQRVEYTTPTEYTPIYAYVREGDARFDNNLEAINEEKITIATIDGTTMAAVADKTFPKAKKFTLPGDADSSAAILNVATGKADVATFEALIIRNYNQHNPDKKLRRVAGLGPLRTFGVAFSVGKGEWELRDMLNTAIAELHGDGTIDKIIAKYETEPGAILRVAKPFAAPVTP